MEKIVTYSVKSREMLSSTASSSDHSDAEAKQNTEKAPADDHSEGSANEDEAKK